MLVSLLCYFEFIFHVFYVILVKSATRNGTHVMCGSGFCLCLKVETFQYFYLIMDFIFGWGFNFVYKFCL